MNLCRPIVAAVLNISDWRYMLPCHSPVFEPVSFKTLPYRSTTLPLLYRFLVASLRGISWLPEHGEEAEKSQHRTSSNDASNGESSKICE